MSGSSYKMTGNGTEDNGTYELPRSTLGDGTYIFKSVGHNGTFTVTISNGSITLSQGSGSLSAEGNGMRLGASSGDSQTTQTGGTQTAQDDNVIDLSRITSACIAENGKTLTGTLGQNVQISIADGATITLNNVSINADSAWTSGDYAGITCEGNATIVLSGTNTVKSIGKNYPGIYVPGEKTLTIRGEGSLDASGRDMGAGIGCRDMGNCGNIVIEGGTITATGGTTFGAGIGGARYTACGNITIRGGNVTARGGGNSAGIGSGYSANFNYASASCGDITITGGNRAAGIGTGNNSADSAEKNTCGNITITSGVIRVTATKGDSATNSIGTGTNGRITGTVTIGGDTTGEIDTSPYTYPSNQP